jgi:hypothetical protein
MYRILLSEFFENLIARLRLVGAKERCQIKHGLWPLGFIF